VLLVQGKCDTDGEKRSLPVAIPEGFTSLSCLEFSAKQDEGGKKLQRLWTALEQAAHDVLKQHPQSEIPVGRVRLAGRLHRILQKSRTQLEYKRRRTLSLERFRTFCEENRQI